MWEKFAIIQGHPMTWQTFFRNKCQLWLSESWCHPNHDSTIMLLRFWHPNVNSTPSGWKVMELWLFQEANVWPVCHPNPDFGSKLSTNHTGGPLGTTYTNPNPNPGSHGIFQSNLTPVYQVRRSPGSPLGCNWGAWVRGMTSLVNGLVNGHCGMG